MMLAGLLAVAAVAGGAPVSFDREVMAVLSKGGCNAGACHGNLNGKGGLKLSLRGENPEADYEALVRQKPGRRVNPADVFRSLVLRKPTLETTHEGGERFGREAPEFKILSEWIAGGALPGERNGARLVGLEVSPTDVIVAAPESSVDLRVEAAFSDGSRRDVTRLACYEPFSFHAAVSADGRVSRRELGEVTVGVRFLHLQKPVRIAFIPRRDSFVWRAPEPANFIDRHVFARLRALRVNPSELADDASFIRRVTLDLTGRLPLAGEARWFVADPSPDKRVRLIDRLLASPEFADYWALKWADLLRVEEKVLDPTGTARFHSWIRESFAANKPLDRFVREILTARGSTYTVAPANYYRALREPQLRSEAVAQVFLGTRVACAKCHNHPFERWTQDDYFRFAALFDRLDYEIKQNERSDKFDKNQFVGEQVVHLNGKAALKDPRTNQPPTPGLLMPEAPPLDAARDRFEQLAEWITDPNHPLFARVQANRLWFQLLGRGLVDPPDDFRATNPPSIPSLLDDLAQEFIAHRYDVKHLIRTICASRTYQLASVPDPGAEHDSANFSHAFVGRHPAEALVDAVHQFLQVDPDFGDDPAPRAVALAGVGTGVRERKVAAHFVLLNAFGKPRRLLNSDVERSNDSSLNQIFALTSGPAVAELIAEPGNRLGRLVASSLTDREIVDELYWSALTRAPGEVEAAVCAGRLAAAGSPGARRAFLEDLAWALINSKEFALRR